MYEEAIVYSLLHCQYAHKWNDMWLHYVVTKQLKILPKLSLSSIEWPSASVFSAGWLKWVMNKAICISACKIECNAYQNKIICCDWRYMNHPFCPRFFFSSSASWSSCSKERRMVLIARMNSPTRSFLSAALSHAWVLQDPCRIWTLVIANPSFAVLTIGISTSMDLYTSSNDQSPFSSCDTWYNVRYM